MKIFKTKSQLQPLPWHYNPTRFRSIRKKSDCSIRINWLSFSYQYHEPFLLKIAK